MQKILIFNDTSRYQHFGCDLVMSSIFHNLRARGLHPISVHRVGTSAERHFDATMRRHPDAKAIVVNGEGVIHHDRKHALGLASLARRAAGYQMPAHLINAALFSNSDTLYRDLAQYTSVHVRDSESQAEAKAHDIDATLVPDLSFESIARLQLAKPSRNGVLITDSVHDEMTVELRRLAREDRADWRPMCRRIAIPCTPLREAGARRFVRKVARSECVLTGRFHAATISIATGTPFLALSSNTRKIEALLHDVFGNERRLLANPIEARTRLRSGQVEFDPAEKMAISQYLELGLTRTRAMFDRLAQ